ncbi:MAG TPA: hypothetical protein VMX17_04870 [Candidatus Glassbacteria bacterium]|nr:hypothetical protein [Candidatus Glassbacteria bacterium]
MNQVKIVNNTIISDLRVISEHYSIYQGTLIKFISSMNEAFDFLGFKYGKVELDNEVPGKANIQFCSDKYQFKLFFDSSNPREASIVLIKEIEDENGENKNIEIGKAIIDKYGSITLPGFSPLGKNEPLHNNLVMFFLESIKKDHNNSK